VGNKRFWPSSLNRSDGDNSPGYKLANIMAPENITSIYGIYQQDEILQASFMRSDDFKHWHALSRPDNRHWDTERFISFKHLADMRRVGMYTTLSSALRLIELHPFVNSE